MKRVFIFQKKGFTLVEVITALIVAAIFGTIIFQYLDAALIGSVKPLEDLGKSHAVEGSMENLIQYFEDGESGGGGWTPPFTMASFRSTIGNVNDNMDNQFGKYTVVENGYIRFNASLQEIADAPGTAPDDILKVTLKNDLGQTATMLFVKTAP